MMRYLCLQLKRALKILPFVLTVTLALFVGVALIISGIGDALRNKEENRPIIVGLVGDTDNEYMQYASAAISTINSFSVSFELAVLEEAEAERRIYAGEISAYVIIPDGFIDKVLYGENTPLKFVTSPGAEGIVPMLKEEISKIVVDIFIHSEKGVFGMEELLSNTENDADVYEEINNLNLEYVALIIDRIDTMEVTELGVSNGLNFLQYISCGIIVFFLFLVGLPYSMLYVKSDSSMNRLLVSKGRGIAGQLASETTAHFISMAINVFAIIGAVAGGSYFVKNILPFDSIEPLTVLIGVIPLIIMVCAYNIFVFEASGNLVSGVLTHFFVSLAMCYVSGCFYPTYTFPEAVQTVAAYLPGGVARDYLGGLLRAQSSPQMLYIMLAYTAAFLIAAYILRRHKITRTGTV